jgi:hypothetical protein
MSQLIGNMGRRIEFADAFCLSEWDYDVIKTVQMTIHVSARPGYRDWCLQIAQEENKL